MRVQDLNWLDVEKYLKSEDRVILPLGSTEQHAYLSVCTDYLLANKLAEDTGGKTQVISYPCLPFGLAPYFMDYPGTINIKPNTYFAFIEDLLDSLYHHGFRRIFIINGHGGNSPVQAQIALWLNKHKDARVILHNWWSSPLVSNKVQSFSKTASHASWMENFPWTRVANTIASDESKDMVDLKKLIQVGSNTVKKIVQEGNYGGSFTRSDEDMLAVWDVAIDETIELLQNGWV